jgi:osmotically-inducible protein OsmY
MKDTDKLLRDVVLAALEQEVEIDRAHIGVIANDGAVALVGFVRSPMQKRAAVRAAARVPGIAAVADELDVRPPGGPARTDAEIAEDIARWRQWAMLPPTLTATVRNGHVTLRGDVVSDEQRHEADRVFRKVHGVHGVKNALHVRAEAVPDDREIERRADDAIRTLADTDARSIHATVVDGTVRLTGTVRSEAESVAAERAASSVSGVIEVANEIAVVP